jgi:hypothetical protein
MLHDKHQFTTSGDEDMAEARPVITDVGGIPKFDANGDINLMGPR